MQHLSAIILDYNNLYDEEVCRRAQFIRKFKFSKFPLYDTIGVQKDDEFIRTYGLIDGSKRQTKGRWIIYYIFEGQPVVQFDLFPPPQI